MGSILRVLNVYLCIPYLLSVLLAHDLCRKIIRLLTTLPAQEPAPTPTAPARWPTPSRVPSSPTSSGPLGLYWVRPSLSLQATVLFPSLCLIWRPPPLHTISIMMSTWCTGDVEASVWAYWDTPQGNLMKMIRLPIGSKSPEI